MPSVHLSLRSFRLVPPCRSLFQTLSGQPWTMQTEQPIPYNVLPARVIALRPARKRTRPLAISERSEIRMKAAVLHELGKPPRYEDFPDPSASAQEALVQIRAASLKSVDKQLAAGTHYASPRELPAICGTDGVGTLPDGSRVFFGGARRPYGPMVELTL